jgi:aminoglycoside phosphotransferase (APT) family kinase protein
MSAFSSPNRDAPSEAFSNSTRAAYPTEREIDRALTRRMARRSSGPFHTPALTDLAGYLTAMLGDVLEGPFELSNLQWLGGGGSKLQMRFTLTQPSAGKPLDLVLRMEPSESLNPSSRAREYEVLKAVAHFLPVPEAFWVDDDARWFPEPTLIYSFSPGVPKPSLFSNKRVTGMGINFGPDLRAKLAPQFVSALARLHAFDFSSSDLPSFDVPAIGSTQSAEWQLNRAMRAWVEDRADEFPLLSVAESWLRRNLPPLDRASILHGDYRSGNFMFDEASGLVTAWLDWERTGIGDRHRDLAWATSGAIGHYAEDGVTLLVCGMLPLEAFLEQYERASGLVVDPKRMQFYTILGRFQQVATVLGTSYRVARLGKSHQDILMARIEAAAYVLAEELQQVLATVI